MASKTKSPSFNEYKKQVRSEYIRIKAQKRAKSMQVITTVEHAFTVTVTSFNFLANMVLFLRKKVLPLMRIHP